MVLKRIGIGVAAFSFAAAFGIAGGGIRADAATVDLAEYGIIPNDGKSDTKAINQAIYDLGEAGGGEISLPAGDYRITLDDYNGNGYGLELKSGVTLKMDAKTRLVVDPNSYGMYEVLRIKGVNNVKVSGGQIIGDKKNHKKNGDNNEGHGVVIKDSTNVTVENMTVKDCWGDGIYIGNWGGKGSNKVNITGCTLSGNRRNNIAITDADNVTIDKCTIKKAKGAQPQCGINIEPNFTNGKLKKSDVCKKITIKNTKVTCVTTGVDNNYFALQIMNPYFQQNNTVVANTVKITNCNLGGDVGNYGGKKVTFSKCTIKGTLYDKKSMKTKLKNTKTKSYYGF